MPEITELFHSVLYWMTLFHQCQYKLKNTWICWILMRIIIICRLRLKILLRVSTGSVSDHSIKGISSSELQNLQIRRTSLLSEFYIIVYQMNLAKSSDEFFKAKVRRYSCLSMNHLQKITNQRQFTCLSSHSVNIDKLLLLTVHHMS